MDEEMMLDATKHRLLSISLIFPLFSPFSGLGSVPYYYLLNRASQVNSERNTGIVETHVDDLDPEIRIIVDKLIFCESSGDPDAIVHDTNGWNSRGLLQFQYPTFRQYALEYNFIKEDTPQEDVLKMMHDPEIPKILAYLMIESDRKNLAHWSVCSKKLELI